MAIHKATKRGILACLMLCWLLVCAGTLQAASLDQLSDAKVSYPLAAHQTTAHKAATSAVPLPPGQLLIPANGQCLYTTIIMGYLLPLRQETDQLTARMAQLFGYPPADYLNPLDQALQNPKDYLSYLHSKEFGFLVNTFMSRMQIAKGIWGGPAEIQTMATKLNVNIQAYYPDLSNRTHLVQSDLTQPAQANADITIHIVRDRVHPAEVLTQAEKESAADNPHYQHYRLKYMHSPSTASSIHLDDHIVDSTTRKKESTAARSADMAGLPAPTGQGDRMEDVQEVSVTPAVSSLIIPKGTTHILPAQAVPHKFSSIKIEEDATLTIAPWEPNQKSGGKLSIHCYGDCILRKNAKISVSGKGYSGSISPHYHGYGPRGGASGTYCAAGGSNSTAGGSGQCRDAFRKATPYHASSPAAAGQVLLTRDSLMCGSGGGYMAYHNSSGPPLSPGADGVSGGGALYVEIDGQLQLAENTAFLANGGEAAPLTGGAGSGGSICLALKGEITFTSENAKLCANAQGGNNQKAIHPTAQGAGGAGHITLYMNAKNQHALKRLVAQPPALVLLRRQVEQRKIYRDELLDDHLIKEGISVANVKRFWQWLATEEMEEDAIMEDMKAASPSQSNIYQFDQAIFQALQRLMNTLAPQQWPDTPTAIPTPSAPTAIPDHVTLAGKYYNAQGVAHAEKVDYPQAVLYHQAARALQTEKYGDQPHPDKADTLLYQAKVAAHQGHYAEAMEGGKAALDMRQQLYQAAAPAHTAIIEARNWLGWLDYQQGHLTQALAQLEDTLQLWRKQHHGHHQELLLADTYSYMVLGQQSLGQYQQAIDKYHSSAQVVAQSASGVPHSLGPTSLHYIGQAHPQLGQYAQAIAPHHDQMPLLAKLNDQAPSPSDKAWSLCTEAMTYLKLWRKKQHGDQQELLLVDTYNYIGLVQQSLGKYQQAIDKYHSSAQVVAQSASGVHHSLRATTLHYIGQAHTQLGQYAQAIAAHHEEMHLLAELHGQDTPQPDKAAALSGIAHTHAAQGHYLLATLFYEKSQTMYQAIYGEQAHHPAIADNLDHLGDLALQQQATGQAMQYYQRAYQMKIALYGEKEPHLAIALSHAHIGQAHRQAHKPEKALAAQEKALAIATAVYGEAADMPIIGRLQREIGLVYLALHDDEHAQKALQISLDIYTNLFGDQPHPDTAHTHYALGEGYLAQSMYKQALDHTSQALHIRQAVYQSVSHHPSITAALLQLGRIQATQAQYNTAIHCYALATRCQVNHLGVVSDLAHFVPVNASLQKTLAHDEQPLPLYEKSILPFLQPSSAQVLLLHGEAGAGKSLYGRLLEKALWEACPTTLAEMEQQPYIIPLFISLPALQDPTQNAISQALQQYGWDKATITYFKQQLAKPSSKPNHLDDDDHKDEAQDNTRAAQAPMVVEASCVIILDGYDEINNVDKPLNLYAAYQLDTWHAKVLVTCRTDHLARLPDHDRYFAPDGKGLQKRYIRPFDAQQIDHYLDQVVQIAPASADPNASDAHSDTSAADRDNGNHWTKEDYQKAFKEMPTLQELIKSPFLLRMITTILPKWQGKAHSTVTRTEVYRAFTHHWSEKALTRLHITGTAAKQKAYAAKAYAAALGFELFFQEEKGLRIESQDKAWQRFLAEADALTYIALLPLRKVGTHQYQFIDKSYQEFFAAQHIYDSLQQLHDSQKDLQAHFAQQVKPYQASDRRAAVQDTQTYHQYAISCPPINQKLLKTAPAIIAFLQDSFVGQQATTCQQWLLQIIKASTRNTKVAIAASNAITLLAGRIPLGRQVWPHIQIPDAVLDRAFLAHTNLQGANLNRVSLREAYLEGAQCQQAQVEGLQFGEYPYFAHEGEVTSVSWSHDDCLLASASWDKTVRVWNPKTGGQVQICRGHDSAVTSVSWSHDDRLLASASYDKSVRVWDAKTGQQVQICTGHTDWVRSVSWSHDSRFFASASVDESVRVWDAKTGLQVQTCTGHKNAVWSVSWSNDDRFLASASYDKSVRVWDAKTGHQVQICTGHDHSVCSVSWSHDDRYLASASSDNSVRVWDAKTGEQVQICRVHDSYVTSVSWSHDDRFLASASADMTVCVWDKKTGEQVQICRGHTNHVMSVSWSHDDHFLASASSDMTVRIWDRHTGGGMQICTKKHTTVTSVGWSHDDCFLASAGDDNCVRVWDAKSGQQVQICRGHDRAIMSVSWSPDDRFLASASEDKSVCVWDFKSGEQVQICTGHDDYVWSVRWSYDGRFLASASWDKSVRVWDAKTGEQVQICTGHEDSIYSVSWSHDDRFLASGSADKTIRVWDAKTGEQVQIYVIKNNYVMGVSWSHDDRFLASASADKTIRVWNAKTGQQVQICTGHEDSIYSVSWSHDDRFLASGSADKTIRVWDAKTGEQVQIYVIKNNYVMGVSWSHDDRFLASASADKTIRVWNAKTGQQVQMCRGHDNAVWSVSWSHDDRFLASVSWDKSVRVWDAKTGEQVQMCRGHDNAVWSVSWSHDDRFLASASSDKSVRVWDRHSGGQVQICTGHLLSEGSSLSWSHDERFFASANDDNSVCIRDAKTEQQVQICTGHTDWVCSVSWSHDDRFLASASLDMTVRVWNAKSGQQVQICTGHTDWVSSVSWSHNDRFLASASADKSVRVWNPKTGAQVQICTGHHDVVNSVSWSHDDRCLASASADKSVRVWDREIGWQLQICMGHDKTVHSVSWSHDDRFLASASADKSVRVWDRHTDQHVQIWTGHSYWVQSVSWSHDDRFLASASSDKSVRVWDAKTGQQVQMYTGHDAPEKHLAWLDNDQHLAAQSDDKRLHVWEHVTIKRTLPKECRTVLVIGRWNGLVLKEADFSGAAGLSDMHKQLITQKKGII